MGRNLLIGSAVCLLMASVVGAQPPTKSNEDNGVKESVTLPMVRIMTFNIRHGLGMDGMVDLEGIAGEIRKSGADIVALQEVDRFWPRSGMQDQAGKLAQELGMYSCFAASLDWGVRQYGNAILSRFPIACSRVEFLNSPKERRSLLAADVRIGDYRLTVLNTHLGLTPQEQSEQLSAIARKLEEVDGPAVLTGDFNMEADHPLLALLPSSYAKIHMRVKAPTLFNGKEIDHIFTNIPVEGLFARTQPTDASDHHPVIVDLPLVG